MASLSIVFSVCNEVTASSSAGADGEDPSVFVERKGPTASRRRAAGIRLGEILEAGVEGGETRLAIRGSRGLQEEVRETV